MNGTCEVAEKWSDDDSLRIRFRVADATLLSGILLKGYVGLDGTSLTVTAVDHTAGTFCIMLVPHTQGLIIIPKKEVGQRVNVELDIATAAAAQAAAAAAGDSSKQGIFCVGAGLVAVATMQAAILMRPS